MIPIEIFGFLLLYFQVGLHIYAVFIIFDIAIGVDASNPLVLSHNFARVKKEATGLAECTLL